MMVVAVMEIVLARIGVINQMVNVKLEVGGCVEAQVIVILIIFVIKPIIIVVKLVLIGRVTQLLNVGRLMLADIWLNQRR